MRSLYSERPTWLHAVPAWLKLLSIAMLGTAFFMIDTPVWLAAGALLVVLAFASLGRATRPALRLVVSVVIVAFMIAGFHAWMGQAMLGLVSALRLASACLLGAMLTLTTRFDELLNVFETLLAPLEKIGVKTGRLSLSLGLMLRFTEHFFVQWRRLDDAHRARTGRAGGFKLLAPLTIRMLVTARRVGDALVARLGQ
ncbi:energy-coupling factor transporter transmembrane protein EcfT [Pigmentiphaga aceris]|uniref:Energy-coupling factor transporter transmembrane protein EcfT n=1 Tax=Pigmentiphaga aceris TaxID=1940612 RepID=A0A5C0AXN1_9BURK|nr:energy-coupling factor transporter transmembrane protein EcfT [Pigmentiphaga aceris]QEI06496.1 energy-coupling factor transporter transmembrane protein EcfT [Pigmentiphaga aceris]